MTIKIKAAAKMDATLYVKIKETNKSFVKKEAKKLNMSSSRYVDEVLDELRKKKK